VSEITQIPALPAQYVDRAADRRTIEHLLNGQGARVAIYGLPGMGKTALAASLAQSVQAGLVLSRVLWADLGQAADPVDVLRGWCQDLQPEVTAVTGTPKDELASLRGQLREAVSGQSVLFVLDDVGSSERDIEAASACLIDDSNCRYLVTTISAQTALRLEFESNFQSHHVDQLREPEATKVLESYAGRRLSLAALSGADRERLLRLGDGLPLGLMVLGRFLGQGLVRGGKLQSLLGKLDAAEVLVRQDEFGAKLRAHPGRDSIYTILTARWDDLSPDKKEALQTAAVFREKPHVFGEAAWACILEARRPSSAEQEDPEELVQRLGASLAMAENRAALESEPGQPVDVFSLDAEDDKDLQLVFQACERLEPLREALLDTGLIEQPVLGDPLFALHSLIAAFLRTIPGFEANEQERVHGLAARYYRGWLAGYQEDHALASPYTAAYRFENRQWLGAMLDLCYHLREDGREVSEDEAVVLLATLFFDAFWWWGALVPYAPCDELLRMWQLAHLGPRATNCLKQLRKFYDNYPIVDLERVKPDDPKSLPGDDQDGTQAAHFQAVRDAVESVRAHVLEGTVDDAAAERDRERLRMLTAIYLGDAHGVSGEFEQAAADYQEALDLLEKLALGHDDGDEQHANDQDTDDSAEEDSAEEKRDGSDDWIIPWVHSLVAELHVEAGDPAKALDACDQGTKAAVGDGEVLQDLDNEDADHEVLGSLWQAAGNAHWQARRRPAAWRSYAWACYHACTFELWPERVVLYGRPGTMPERVREFCVDDYTVVNYKLHLAKMLDRLGELWTAGRRAEACAGVRLIRETLAGGPDRPHSDPDGKGRFDEVAALRPEASWAEVRDVAWQDTGLAGLALPLIPWERLVDADGRVDPDRVENQRSATSDLMARLTDIWASSKWTLGDGPGQRGLSLEANAIGAAEST
jgi:tetratricopeptide (TPR) repeat protein